MDVIVGDSDGVIVVPKTVAEDVLLRMEARKEQEDKTRELIRSGMSAEQAAIKMGYKDLWSYSNLYNNYRKPASVQLFVPAGFFKKFAKIFFHADNCIRT